MTNYADAEMEELIPVFVGRQGQPHPRLARALMDMGPGQVESGYGMDGDTELVQLQIG
jgi:hypothetical protein